MAAGGIMVLGSLNYFSKFFCDVDITYSLHFFLTINISWYKFLLRYNTHKEKWFIKWISTNCTSQWHHHPNPELELDEQHGSHSVCPLTLLHTILPIRTLLMRLVLPGFDLDTTWNYILHTLCVWLCSLNTLWDISMSLCVATVLLAAILDSIATIYHRLLIYSLTKGDLGYSKFGAVGNNLFHAHSCICVVVHM